MKINLPRELKGFTFDLVVPIEFNTFDVDLLLPSLYFKSVSRGQGIGRMVNDPTQIAEYARKLADHPDVRGMNDNERTIHLTDRLIRTTLLQIGRRGSQRNVEQIQGLLGYTLLAFKPGFPKQQSLLRRVDELLYRMLSDRMRGEEHVLSFFRGVFGMGLALQTGAKPDGRYDGTSQLDTVTRLAMAYLDEFKPTGTRRQAERSSVDALPGVSGLLARDLRRYMVAYHSLMPVDAFTYHLKALINFELFAYSMKLFYAVADLGRVCKGYNHRRMQPMVTRAS